MLTKRTEINRNYIKISNNFHGKSTKTILKFPSPTTSEKNVQKGEWQEQDKNVTSFWKSECPCPFNSHTKQTAQNSKRPQHDQCDTITANSAVTPQITRWQSQACSGIVIRFDKIFQRALETLIRTNNPTSQANNDSFDNALNCKGNNESQGLCMIWIN